MSEKKLSDDNSESTENPVDQEWMQRALELAAFAPLHGDVPIGAVVVGPSNEELGWGWNTRERDQDPCGHAEIHALRQAAKKLGSWRLEECVVYVSLEPCAMCAGAMVLARIKRCVWAAPDPKGGYLGTLGNLGADGRLNHRFEVTGEVRKEESAALLRGFFRELRQKKS